MVVALSRAVVAALSFAFLAPGAASAAGADHLRLRLVSAHEAVAPGGDVYIGLEQRPAKGWHTYWVNPGDTGLAPEIEWELPEGVSIDDALWPTPSLIEYSGGASFGYDRPSTLVYRLRNRSALKPGERLSVTAHIFDLVCENMCEPVETDVTLTLAVAEGASSPEDDGALAHALAELPRKIEARPSVVADERRLTARFSLASFDDTARADFASPEGAYLFLEKEGIAAPASTQELRNIQGGFELSLQRVNGVPLNLSTPAVLKFANGHAYELTLAPVAASAAPPRTASPGFWAAIVFAFAGGLILNFMPCVFPILSMKLLALSRAGHDRATARKESVVYGLGVMASFLVLALMLEIARSLGAAVGWGFQLQSPGVTAFLSLLMLLVAFNMSGLFEVGAGLQAIAGQAGMSMSWATHPYMNALLTGVLAVVVAAPCSAPFMATAVGAALSQDGATGLAIFAALGAGFAAPFVAIAHGLSMSPSLIRLLPKPGIWMMRLRQILSVPMYGAAMWMAWVFYRQAGALGLMLLLLAFALLGVSLARPRFAKSVTASGVIAALALFLAAAAQTSSGAVDAADGNGREHAAFSPEALETLRAQNRPVLLDLTAAWCVTCKVNERLVLSNSKVVKALAKTGTVYMVGDWTRQDPTMTAFLSELGRSGVPLYVYYAPGGKAPLVLPQLLNAGDVIRAVEGGRAAS